MIEEKNITALLNKLFTSWIYGEAFDIKPLGSSGSPRKYFRIYGRDQTAIGVYSSIEKENRAFISFSRHFLKNNLPVPKIYQEDLNNCVYLIEDLGDETLFQLLPDNEYETLPEKTLNYYLQAIDYLPYFQTKAGKSINESHSFI